MKRSPENDISDYEPDKRKQVFAHPTYDFTAKYMLDDDNVRLDFVKTFANLNDVESTTKLDDKSLTNFREFICKRETKSFLKQLEQKPDSFIFKEKLSDGKELDNTAAKDLIVGLQENYNDLSEILPQERNSQLEFLCKLKNGDHVAVAVQIAKKENLDNRVLAYVSSVYGNQLQKGDKWGELKKVIGINILGGGEQDVQHWKDETAHIRHYIMQDKNNSNNVINGLELIQYSLGDSDLKSPFFEGKKELKDWLHLFKNAQNEKEVPQDVSDEVKMAYERLKIEEMPKEIRELYIEEEGWFEQFSEHWEKLKEKTVERVKKEIAISLLKANFGANAIKLAMGLSEEQMNAIRDDLR